MINGFKLRNRLRNPKQQYRLGFKWIFKFKLGLYLDSGRSHFTNTSQRRRPNDIAKTIYRRAEREGKSVIGSIVWVS